MTALVLAVVMAASILFVLPAGTPGRSVAVGAAAPYYSQNWRVFAPHIMKSNTELEIRAQWRDDNGELVTSDWLPVTAIEQRRVAGGPVPSRTQKLSWNATLAYAKRYRALDEQQQARVRDTFIEKWEGGYRPIPVEELIAELGEDDAKVVRFLRMDYMLMRYATLFATAGLGKDIERVQWRTVITRDNDIHHRFIADSQFSPAITEFGWRQSNLEVDDAVVAEFEGMIERNGATDELGHAARAAG